MGKTAADWGKKSGLSRLPPKRISRQITVDCWGMLGRRRSCARRHDVHPVTSLEMGSKHRILGELLGGERERERDRARERRARRSKDELMRLAAQTRGRERGVTEFGLLLC